MANGDTYFVTNCSPQVKGFNQAPHGEFNWGDLENMVQQQTRAEKAIVFAGPALSKQDRIFVGEGENGLIKVQIPRRFWKIIIAETPHGVKAFGFMPEQDLSNVFWDEEFAVPADWRKHQVSIEKIEDQLSGLLSLSWCKKHDGYER